MKKSILMILLLLLVYFFYAQTTVILNSDFEDGKIGKWVGFGSASLKVTKETAYKGNFSLLTKNRTEASNGPSIDLTGKIFFDRTYRFSVWVKIKEGQPNTIMIMTVERSKNGKRDWTRIIELFSKAGTWVNLIGDYETKDDFDKTFVYIESSSAKVEYYIDEISITEKKAPAYEPQEKDIIVKKESNKDTVKDTVVKKELSKSKSSYLDWIDLQYTPFGESGPRKGKLFFRDIIDMRLSKGKKEEEEDFTFIGFMRNTIGVPYPNGGTLPGHEIDVVLKKLIPDALNYSGYKCSDEEPDGTAPVIDIGLLRFQHDSYMEEGWIYLEFRVMVYAKDGDTKLFEADIFDRILYPISMGDFYYNNMFSSWKTTISKMFAYLVVLFKSNVFLEACQGKDMLEQYALNKNYEKLTNIQIEGDEENLIYANFMGNKIAKIEGLDSLSNLIFLILTDNKITRIGNLNTLDNLKVLSLHKNKINKIENIDGLSNLTVLDLGYNNFEKIENLNDFKNIEWLFLNDCSKLKKIENLDNLNNLRGIDFMNCSQLSRIENLNKLKRLKYLSFGSCMNIKEINGLDNLTNLKELIISKTGITKLENLDNLVNLEYLDISFNRIERLENLDNLLNLKKIVLFRTSISTLENLESLKNLEELIITKNYILGSRPKNITSSTYEFLKENDVIIDGQMYIDEYIEKNNVKII